MMRCVSKPMEFSERRGEESSRTLFQIQPALSKKKRPKKAAEQIIFRPTSSLASQGEARSQGAPGTASKPCRGTLCFMALGYRAGLSHSAS
jgi:hypothetical protein